VAGSAIGSMLAVVDAIPDFFPKPAENHFPAVVWSTLVTAISAFLPINLRAFVDDYHSSVIQISNTLIVSLPSFKMKTRIASPGRTTGFRAFAAH